MAHFRRPDTLPDDEIGGPAAPGRWFVGTANTPERQALERAAYRDLAGRFDIIAVLQRGPSSVLYDARDIEGDRRVALRVISRAALDGGLEERLVRALSESASMDHPNIVAVQRSGAAARVLWYAMEFVEGPSLATLLRDRGPLDFRLCLNVVEQVAAALQYAHRRGVVHGDIHPANIFLFGAGWALVSDFAMGRLLASLSDGGWSERQRPVYRAPEEEATELPPSPSADQYALALTTWECLTGASPGAQHDDHTLAARLGELRPDLPRHVGAALERALRSRPSERFPTVQDLVTALTSAGSPPVTSAPPRMSEPSAASQRLLFVEHTQRRRSGRAIAGSAVVIGALVMGILSFRQRDGADAFSPAVPILAPETGAAASTAASRQPTASRPEPRQEEEPRSSTPAVPDPSPEQTTTGAETVADPPADDVAEPAPPPAPNRSGSARPREQRRSTVPRQTPAATNGSAATSPVPVEPAALPGRLFISSRPWGQVFVDGQLVGNTPMASVSITAGTHVIRVVRSGFQSYEREIQVAPGQDVRLVDLVLEAVPR